MKLRLILILIISLLCASLFAQYDEKQILLKNAANMIKVRKYTLAEELYQEAVTKFPDDPDIVIAFLELYVRTNKGPEGNELLRDKGKLISKAKEIEYQVTFLLMEKKFDVALVKAQAYLENNNSQVEYKSLGSLFQRYRSNSQATQLFLVAEELYPNEFAFELADSYYYERNFDEAIGYYLLALENNVGNKSLINSRISSIIRESPNSILTLIDYFGTDSDKLKITKDNMSIINVYVDALLNTDRADIALAILDKFESKDIYTKAEQFKRNKKYKVSKLLFELTLEKEKQLDNYYRYSLNFAKMLVDCGAYAEADSLVNTIIFTETDQKYKRNIMFDSYLLKADLTKQDKTLSYQYENYLNEAGKFATNNNQKQTLKAKMSYYQILKQDYSQAKKTLGELARFGRNDNYYFNYYLYEVFQNGAIADSLATELIIIAPDSDLSIEMLELKYLLKPLNPKDKNLYLDAYRKEKLNSIEQADSLYQEIYSSTKNEYFIIKNALMNKQNNNITRARELLSGNFEDEFCHDFAAMSLILLEDDNSQIAKDMARNFLTQYPNSSFAAEIRQILMINQNN